MEAEHMVFDIKLKSLDLFLRSAGKRRRKCMAACIHVHTYMHTSTGGIGEKIDQDYSSEGLMTLKALKMDGVGKDRSRKTSTAGFATKSSKLNVTS